MGTELVHLHLVITGVQIHQSHAGFYRLIALYIDRFHRTCNAGGNGIEMSVYLRIVGGLVGTRVQPPGDPCDQHNNAYNYADEDSLTLNRRVEGFLFAIVLLVRLRLVVLLNAFWLNAVLLTLRWFVLRVFLRAIAVRLLPILTCGRFLIFDRHYSFPFSMCGMNCSACPVALARLMRERLSEKRVLM